MIITDSVFLPMLKDLLDIHSEVTMQTPFNLFEYDSFTKVNIILAIEMYASVDAVEFDALIECDTFQDVVELADQLKVSEEYGV